MNKALSLKPVEHLEWDSNFFGCRVGRISSDALHKYPSLILQELDLSRIDLAYYFSEQVLSNKKNYSLNGYDICFTNVQVTYSKILVPSQSFQLQEIEGYLNQFPDKQMIKLALESGSFSRFSIDPKISKEKFKQLYSQWIAGCIERRLADVILTYNNGGEIHGFVTISIKDEKGYIGLIAVDEDERGKGIGKKLIKAAEIWLTEKNIYKLEIVTQQENVPACKLYTSCGYVLIKKVFSYHIWKTSISQRCENK